MLSGTVLEGKHILLRDIDISDCNENYLRWMCDEETNQYMETRWQNQSIELIRQFVIDKINSADSVLFAIVEINGNKHIGNIKIGPINSNNSFADISYFIGDKECWNKGYASEAINLATEYGFEVLKLHRLEAGVIAGNIGSSKALEKNGYKQEGCFIENSRSKAGKYLDVFRYGIINKH